MKRKLYFKFKGRDFRGRNYWHVRLWRLWLDVYFDNLRLSRFGWLRGSAEKGLNIPTKEPKA